MKRILSIVAILIMAVSLPAMSQDLEQPYGQADLTTLPSFPGGKDMYLAFIKENQVYPESSKANGYEGSVFFEVIFEKTGAIRSYRVTYALFEDMIPEAIRLLEMFPNFEPGKIKGEAVPCLYMISVPFKLED